jgi:hypothetical protein
MQATKQGTQYTIGLESVLCEARAHVKSLEGVRAHPDCDLLFPSRGRGGGNTMAPFEASPGCSHARRWTSRSPTSAGR